MSECVTRYPADLPLGCIQTLITIVREGSMTERAREFAAAAWTVVGYCLKTFVGEPAPVINGPPPPLQPEVRRQVVELEQLLSAATVDPVGSQLSVFLRTVVLPVLVAALRKLLETISE